MLAALLSLSLAAAPQQPAPVLVTTDWLAARLQDPDLVIFHIGDNASKPTYDAGHVPGAQFLTMVDVSAPRTPDGLALELPSAERIDSVLEARGVSNSSRIVLYSADQYFSPTSRAFFALEYAGLTGRVVIMDGGLEAWKAENRPVSTEVPTPRRGSFQPAIRTDLVADAGWIRSHLNDARVAVIDARTTNFYNGAETRQDRVGRIAGAGNVPFNTVVTESGKFKDVAALKAILAAAGAQEGDTVVTYCHIGQQASLVWFAARLLGHPVKLYDGSFEDWSARHDMPVEAPAPTVRDSMVVTAQWLKQNEGASDLVVLYAGRNRATYDSGHVPGARFADYTRYTARGEATTNELPPPEQLGQFTKELGLTPRHRVVIYGDPIPAARLFFTLEYLGLARGAAILDGGLGAWQEAGYALSTEAPVVTPATFQPRPWPFLAANADLVKRRLGDTATVLLDVRAPDEFSGARAAEGVRPGHLPGAVNLDWTTFMSNGRFKPAAELRAMFDAAGIGPNDEVIVYCQSGARASVGWFVARYLGWRPRLYDGSMEEWGRRAELPIER